MHKCLKKSVLQFLINQTLTFVLTNILWLYTVAHPYLQFCFPRFQLPKVNWGPKILNGNLQKWTIYNFKLCAVLNSQMKPLAILLHPAQAMNRSSVQCVRTTSRLIATSAIRSTVEVSQCLCSRNPYITNNGPQSTRVVMLAIWICQG